MNDLCHAGLKLVKYMVVAALLGAVAVFILPPRYSSLAQWIGIAFGLLLCGKSFLRDLKAFHNAIEELLLSMYNEYQRLKQNNKDR